MSRYVVWGGRGHGKVLAELIQMKGGRLEAFFDRDPSLTSPDPCIPLFCGEAGFDTWLAGADATCSVSAVAAIGGSRGRDRCEYLDMFRSRGLLVPALVHPRAIVSESALVGENCHVLAGAIVAVEVVVGEASIVNTGASVDHECRLGRGVHIAPGAILCGAVHIGDFSMVGAGAVVLPNIRIGSDSIVAAGSTVTRDVDDGVVVMGSPARVIRINH